MSCDNGEDLPSKNQSTNYPQQLYIINGDLEYYADITDGSKPKKPIFVYDIPKEADKINTIQKTTYKNTEQSVSINFGYGIGNPTNSGCTVKRFNNGNSYYTDAGVYGGNPYSYPYPETTSYLVRGFNTPHLNPYYGSLILFVSNKEIKSSIRNGIWHDNDKRGSAISIEYPFKANITYEISMKVTFHDNRYLTEKVFSDGLPTIFVQLKDDGTIVQDIDPCDNKGINNIYGYYTSGNDSYLLNYTRSYTLESRGVIQRTLAFKFSPTEEKKALLISVHPATSRAGYGAQILKNNYTMVMPLINISEKPFDPSLNVEIKTPPSRR